MLARAYVHLERFDDSLPAFVKAVALNPTDARLLADYADAMAVTRGRKLEGELLETMKSQGKQVVELTEEERKLFRQACKQSTLTKFLGSHPELQPVYGQVKAKLDAMK